MLDDKELQVLAERVFGDKFNGVKASFFPYPDLKIAWTRRKYRAGTFINFLVSDYLMDASPEIITKWMEALKERMFNGYIALPDDLRAWLTSEDFLAENIHKYRMRHDFELCDAVEVIAQDLVEEGLLDDIDGISFGLTDDECPVISYVFKTVAVPKIMATDPPEIIKALIYAGVRYAKDDCLDKSESKLCKYIDEYGEKIRGCKA